MKQIIGTQVYGLKQEFEQDLEGTLEQIARMGFGRIEPLVVLIEEQLPMIPADIWSLELLGKAKKMADSLGLLMPTIHVGAGLGSPEQPDRMIADGLLRIQDMTGAGGFVFSGMFSDTEDAKRCGEHLGMIADYVTPRGASVIYHNHDDEWHLIEVNGEQMPAMDYFYKFAGTDVRMELDIGWTALVCDELETAKKYRNQITDLHCRDFSEEAFSGAYTRQNMPAEFFVPVGTGSVKVREVCELARKFPNFRGEYVVEQEKSVHGMLTDMEASLRKLQEWLSA